MTQIICLANSWKEKGRCIAGINPINGRWIRPVSDLSHGQIEKELINEMKPELLDIVDIPLADTGPNFDFQSENLSVLSDKWEKKGKIKPVDLLKYCSQEEYILHNNERFVEPDFMQSLSEEQRRTLQLVQAVEFSVVKDNYDKWKGTLKTQKGQNLTAKITDVAFVEKLESNYKPKNSCFLTISLSLPWCHQNDLKQNKLCWKLIAGVVELPEGEFADKNP